MIKNYKIIEETATRFTFRSWSKKFACFVGFIASILFLFIATSGPGYSFVAIARLLIMIQVPLIVVFLMFVLPLTTVEIDNEQGYLKKTWLIRGFTRETIFTLPLSRVKRLYSKVSRSINMSEISWNSLFIDITDSKNHIKLYSDTNASDVELLEKYLRLYVFPRLNYAETIEDLDRERKSLAHLFGDDPDHILIIIFSGILFAVGFIAVIPLLLSALFDPSIYDARELGTFFWVFLCSLMAMTVICGVIFFHFQKKNRRNGVHFR